MSKLHRHFYQMHLATMKIKNQELLDEALLDNIEDRLIVDNDDREKQIMGESSENASDLSTDSGSVVDDELPQTAGFTTDMASSIPEGTRLPVF